MPSLSTARRVANAKTNNSNTIGDTYHEMSDFIMEETWDNDPQSKICYIYDYFHDDKPLLNRGMTYENTIKTKISAKFIVTQYGSISKDQVAYHLMFKPSQPVEFTDDDELYYFEKDYRKKFNVQFPSGLYIDIPNERNIYEKWLIINKEQGLSFIKYNILPCNYLFEWIEIKGDKSYMRRMWGVDRQQLSYDAGTWIDRYINSLNNVEKAYLPLNTITTGIEYVGENGENQRMIISARVETPTAWKVTKIEAIRPVGLIQLTFSQSEFDQNRDYLEKDSDGQIIGMWADYYKYTVVPESDENVSKEAYNVFLSSATQTIKVGGSYKQINLNIINGNNEDVTSGFSSYNISWYCYVDEVDITNDVKWVNTSSFNKVKIKFLDDTSYLNKILVIKCVVNKDENNLEAKLSLTITS